MWEEPFCHAGAGASTGSAPLLPPWGKAVRTWERRTPPAVLAPAVPPCTGDACMVPCRGMLQNAFWVHIGFWHLGLAGSSEFKAEFCLHEKGLLGLCFKPASCNKMLVKGWLKPQPKFQTCPLPRPRASRRPWDPEVNLCPAGPRRTSSSQVTHSLLLSWSNGVHTLSNQSF